MRPIQDILGRIQWKELDKECFTIEYVDFGKLSSIPYKSIKRVEGLFMIVEKEGEDVEIPLHRVRKVRKSGEVIWERKTG